MIVDKVLTIGIITVSFMSLYLIDDIIEKRKRNKYIIRQMLIEPYKMVDSL